MVLCILWTGFILGFMLVLLVLGNARKVTQTGLKVSQTEGVTVLVRELIKQHFARFIRMEP